MQNSNHWCFVMTVLLHTYTHLHNLRRAYAQAHALRPGFAIDLFHQIKGCWSHYRSGLSRSWACRCRRQMCLAAFLAPLGLLTLSHGEMGREKWDLWVNLHRSRYTISNDVMHPSSRWHHMFLSLSPAVTSLRLMDALMSFPRHFFLVCDALHMQKLFEIWYDGLKWSSHERGYF